MIFFMTLKKIICTFAACAAFVIFADELDAPVLKDEWRSEVLKSLDLEHPALGEMKKLYLGFHYRCQIHQCVRSQ